MVIGAGPGGLAVAAALHQRGVRTLVIERSETVASSWRAHYERLHLHTTRRLSGLPGFEIPRAYGRWVGRDDVIRYLEQYAAHHRIDIATGIEVSRIDRAESADGTSSTDRTGATGSARSNRSTGGTWQLPATGGRLLTAPIVVVATGHNHTPHLPDRPGRDTYPGELLHAAHYRNAEPYAGRDVLVVGVGNTGAEIAVDLIESGAARVRLAVRTPPHIMRRSTAGWPAQASGILCRRLPVALVDRVAPYVERLSVPDLSAYGLARPTTGLYSRVRDDNAIPVQDVGLIDAIRAGRVEAVAAVEGFDGDKVVLTDRSRIGPEIVIAATGYRRDLEPLVGHLGVLDAHGRPLVHGPHTPPGAPGLYFTGFTNPISGMFRELAIDARRIARAAGHASRRA
ncbi:NAD(P)/FAD-dependent oxidoreductase [Streptomyces sp. H10-C2]|uniref:flavin-containing monooxygenase n=1 Tax=unclassified Streptomyces TaxID=2593676 RepID=UPI0024BB203F|nr:MULTISPECIES: NAD(P)/FAD-dependent oxidoreductase [unclassified Streptomyces]MDJ0342435.1 NAD(P)/FAD-dependent oxidoreductase [Streptomyces sp. PH10-H1]MDJ0372290.1 NAD(P)/FAD-dependent oxidoreductase [Streptomyces sp. H10-C2]